MTRSPFETPARRPRPALIAALALLASASPAAASQLRETSDFADVVAAVADYANRYGAEQVLLVCDLDNTLLAMADELGSDQWFEWQVHLLTAKPDSPHLVARDFAGLLAVQGGLFDLLPARLTQPDLPLLVGRIQGLGGRTIVLTARGHEFRGATQYELKRHGFDFADHAVELADRGPESTAAGVAVFVPYRRESLEASGLTQAEFAAWRLKDVPDQVSYGNGIYMVAGQHKGAMLAVLLERAAQSFKAMVLVDQDRQVRRLFDALSRRDYEVTAFDYQREEARVKAFQYGDQSAATRQWRRLNRILAEDDAASAAAHAGR
ncbi:MAG: hypothetical protein DCC67_14655 [Planctomycetota bacterium]|nr:MAG: hypothetical protein DCC67_14655 [Planctomycetota bacterium]